MNFNRLGLAITSLCLLHAAGCTKSSPTISEVVEDIDKKTGLVAVNEQQAMELVAEIQAAAADLDADALYLLIDTDAFFDRVFVDLGLREQVRNTFISGVEQSGGFLRLMIQITQTIEQGGSLRFIRLVKKDGAIRPLFRLSLPVAGVNYYEFVLTESAGKTRIADMHVMLSGELLSTTVRRPALEVAADENRSLVDQLSGAEGDYMKHTSDLQELVRLGQSEDVAAFMTAYRRLPQSLQQDRNWMLLRCRVTRSDNAEYVKAIEAIETQFPNDPSNCFRAIDRHALAGEHQAVLENVDQLIAHTADPFLNTLRLNALVALKRFDEATESAQKAIAAEPDNIKTYLAAIGVSFAAQDHARTLDLLRALESNFQVELEDMSAVPGYAEFVKSPEHQEWLKRK